MPKKYFLDEPRDMIASMRRNNGDAIFQHLEDDDKAFVEWRSAMHSVPTTTAECSDDVGHGPRSGRRQRSFKVRTAAGANGAS
jgi:hypothetical protein